MSPMKFFEKDLESLIYDDYMGCQDKGLTINSERFIGGLHFRQLRLGTFGVADLVNINYNPAKERYLAQIIECKRGAIDASTYLQAKRYEMGVNLWIGQTYKHGLKPAVLCDIETVLIGDDYCEKGAIGLVAGLDSTCSMYTFKYGLTGIEFNRESTGWYIGHEDPSVYDASPKEIALIAKNLKIRFPKLINPSFERDLSFL